MIFIVLLPLFMVKTENAIFNIVPLGISFYTLQMIAYIVDVCHGKISPQKNILKFSLFLSFFPQIIQGPIPRYEQLKSQLYNGRIFDEKGFSKGVHLIIWGFFLKLIIADKAGIFVDVVFADGEYYAGGYIFVAALLYSIQLYADFQSCVCIAQGVSALFGIHLTDNFKHPYKADSVKDFWRRWHISLSSWLRDYIYIPLGGNRKGRLRKYLNLIITFIISGIWHGTGLNFFVWGLLHSVYQIIGDVTFPVRQRVYGWLQISEENCLRKIIQVMCTFFCVMIAWIFFRAENLKEGIKLIKLMLTIHNPWIFWDNSLFELGLSIKEFGILFLGITILAVVSYIQARISLSEWILKQHIILRWGLYTVVILFIIIFGTYGYGISQQNFIYGGF